ncbi:hypothetical protein B0H17DRAFT_1181185 [Mycena rosella]|uniref:SET domain-containing protein n=1 Tax=Mycena rosella TaxID=1033263 RepID=A0AAD7DD89_MYCRO|nr:hypothetical protein B0H17DRAFT_1181185 [Mycena rosella]
MKRGFLNSGKAKAKLTKDTDKIAARSGHEPEPQILKRSYGVVENAGKSQPEGYETMKSTVKLLDPLAPAEAYDKNMFLYTTQPSVSMDATLASFPDGWTECLLYADAKALLLSTPGFPSPLIRPSSRSYRLASSPSKGLGLFSTRKIRAGELILSERPLTVTPSSFGNKIRFMREFTEHEKFQAQLYEWEQTLKILFDRLCPEYKTAFMALANSHQHDGSGPIGGIIRTNSLGLESLQTGGHDRTREMYSAVALLLYLTTPVLIPPSRSPNTDASFDLPSFSYRLFAIREIHKGEELTFAYTALSPGAKTRQLKLEPYGFQCTCAACRTPLESDARRAISLSMQIDTVKDGLAKLSLLEEEGLQSMAEYSIALKSVTELYIALGDSNHASKYARMLVNRPWDIGVESIVPYTTPLGIESHPLWRTKTNEGGRMAMK